MAITLDKSIERNAGNTIDISVPYSDINVKSENLVNDVVSHVEAQIVLVEDGFNTMDNTLTGLVADATASKLSATASATSATSSAASATASATSASASSLSAQGSANYQGAWTSKGYTLGQTVSDTNGVRWVCKLTHTTAQTASEGTYWTIAVPYIGAIGNINSPLLNLSLKSAKEVQASYSGEFRYACESA